MQHKHKKIFVMPSFYQQQKKFSENSFDHRISVILLPPPFMTYICFQKQRKNHLNQLIFQLIIMYSLKKQYSLQK